MSAPAVIGLGQVIVDLTMRLDAVPRPGEDMFAADASPQVGASYNMLHAVRRMGVAARHGGILGRGPWADLIDLTLRRDGIAHIGRRYEDEDCGFCIAMTDAQAERTFVSVRGAEAHGDQTAFDGIDPAPGDVVYLSGYTLAHDTARGLLAFLERTAAHRFTAIVDASPLIGQADEHMLRALVAYRPIWSCNEREAALLAARLGVATPQSPPATAVMLRAMADRLGATLIVRVGAGGAWVARPGDEPAHIAGFPVTPLDTNGAGDCHTGVLAARLALGDPLERAVRLANAAASIAVTRPGPATCPTLDDLRALIPDA